MTSLFFNASQFSGPPGNTLSEKIQNIVKSWKSTGDLPAKVEEFFQVLKDYDREAILSTLAWLSLQGKLKLQPDSKNPKTVDA